MKFSHIVLEIVREYEMIKLFELISKKSTDPSLITSTAGQYEK